MVFLRLLDDGEPESVELLQGEVELVQLGSNRQTEQLIFFQKRIHYVIDQIHPNEKYIPIRLSRQNKILDQDLEEMAPLMIRQEVRSTPLASQVVKRTP